MENIKKFGLFLKNIILSYAIMLILFMVYALLLEFTDVPESSIPAFTFITMIVCVFIASSLSSIRIKEKGLINGGIVGGIYIAILYLLSSIFSTGFSINAYTFWIIAGSIIIGMLGGIIGVNMCKEGR